MKKCFNKTLRVFFVLAILFAGNNILGLDLGAEVAYASGVTHTFIVDLGSTWVRSSTGTASSPGIGNHLATIPRGATFHRTNHEPIRRDGWTWVRGTLEGSAAQRRGPNSNGGTTTIGENTAVWISTSQLTRPATNPDNFRNSPGHVVNMTLCRVELGSTVLRYEPTLGINPGNRAVLNNRGAHFVPVGANTASNAGFTWVNGSLHGNATQTTGSPRNGNTRTRFNHGIVWIANSQLVFRGASFTHSNC